MLGAYLLHLEVLQLPDPGRVQPELSLQPAHGRDPCRAPWLTFQRARFRAQARRCTVTLLFFRKRDYTALEGWWS